MKKTTVLIILLLTIAGSSSQLMAQTIGLQLYSLRNELKENPEATLNKIGSWGIKYLEGGETYGLPFEKFQKILKDNNMKVVSVGADFYSLRDSIPSVVAHAKRMGAEYVISFWIPHQGNDFTLANTNEAIEIFNTAGKKLREEGLKLCYHPHGFEFRPYENGTLFDHLVTKTDPRYVNFEMDVFWVKHPGQDPVALFNKYPDRFLLMHLKDRKPGTPDNPDGWAPDETNVVLGQGDVGIEAIMRASKKSKVAYYFIEDESPEAVNQIPESLKYLEGLKKKK